MSTQSPPSLRSLAGVRPGESLVVRRILFDALRTHCSALDLREGQRVRCRSISPTRVMLETSDGRVVAFERDWARFIQVA
jgi:hypothetical protein